MGDPLKKVRPGAKLEIPAEAFNSFIDAARDYKMRQRNQDVGNHLAPWKQADIVPVRNETGFDRQRFDIVGLKSPIILPTDNIQEFQNRPSFIAEPPIRDLNNGHIGRFAVLQEPCINGAIVPAVVSGITIARVNAVAEWHEKADVQTNGYSELISGEVGSATILWKEPGLGTRWAIIRLDDFVIDDFWARIVGVTNESPNRWKYSFIEVVKSGEGYGAWTPGGFNRIGEAYNSVEDPNDGQGLEGNGIDIDALSQCVCGEQSCCHLLPAGIGAVVRMKEVRYGAQPQIEYWFAYENEVDCCPSSSSGSSSSESGSSGSSSELSTSSSSESGVSSSEISSSEISSSEASSSSVSSSSESSSGSSSSSSSSGDPCNCITVITNVSFDENGCLTVTSRELCVPIDCPMGDEYTYVVCPSSSSGSSESSESGEGPSSSSESLEI